jgi:hypothetical protein
MKRAIAVLCLLGALCANAGNICPDNFPLECQLLCSDLRRGVVASQPLPSEMFLWLEGYPYGISGPDCETDVRMVHNDAAVCADARERIYIETHRFSCMHFPGLCTRTRVQCMMNDPKGWTTPEGYPCF